jgi:hypothetical protein
MKLDSKYFDMIRIRPRAGEGAKRARATPVGCQWKGCELAGTFRAPMGRGKDGQFFHFCEEHVRQYNASYNFFDGMSDNEADAFRKDALTGHRPTWKMSANAWTPGGGTSSSPEAAARFSEARVRQAQGFHAWRARQARAEARAAARRRLKPMEVRSLEALDLTESATKSEIKARFKALVKRHHPDSNGGDRGTEDKLREIIQAYNYLKQAGLV